MPKHYTAELTRETAEAVAANTNHCVTGYYFFKFLKGIQVGSELIPLKVQLNGEFAQKQGVEGKVITCTENGFMDENGVRIDDIWTINTVICDIGFKFGIRFKWENTPATATMPAKVKMFVN